MNIKSSMLIGGLVLAALGAQAHVISLGAFTNPDRPASANPQAEATWVDGKLDAYWDPDLTGDLTFLGRVDGNGSNVTSDPFNFFLNDKINVSGYIDSDDRDATVSWNLTGTGWSMAAVFVKDGSHDTLYAVSVDQLFRSDGDQVVSLATGLKGGISHLSFFGIRKDSTSVSDTGTTLAFLGAGITAIGLARRRTH